MDERPELERPLRLEDLEPRHRRRLIARSVLLSSLLVGLIIVVYYFVPWDGDSFRDIAVRLAVCIVTVIAVTVVSVQYVLRAEFPVLRVFEVLAGVIALTIASFASAYAYLSFDDPAAFSEALSRTDALYFAVTTSTTVGFGDISASTEFARVLVMIQMVVNVVVIGVAARSLMFAARRRADLI